jgi:hypothetical protein
MSGYKRSRQPNSGVRSTPRNKCPHVDIELRYYRGIYRSELN